MTADLFPNLTRRSFVKMAGSAAAVSAVAPRALAAPAIGTGIQLYTVKEDFAKDPAATLKKIAAIGYTEVEIAGYGSLTPAQLHDHIRDAGLRAPSAHLQFGFGPETSKLLDDAHALGVEFVVSSVLPPHPPDMASGMQKTLQALNAFTADDFKQIAARANEIGRAAKAAGLRYAYHNHNFEFRDLGGGHTGYDILLSETDPDLVHFEGDCGWMSVAGADPVKLMASHPGRYLMLHIKDFKGITHPVTALMAPDAPKPTEVGRGSVNNAAIVPAGLKAGVQHMFVEQEPPYTEMPAIEAADVDYKALHALLVRG